MGDLRFGLRSSRYLVVAEYDLEGLVACNDISLRHCDSILFPREIGLGSYQQPPACSRRSNTRIVSKTCSRASASTHIAPAGPAPMTATLLILCALDMMELYYLM